MKIGFSVPETLLSRITAGASITGRTDAFAGRTYQGIVRTVDSRVDPITRAVEVRAEIPNADGSLQPGMLLTVRLTLAHREGSFLVPEEALVPSGVNQFVYVVENNRAALKPITIGERLGGLVEVRTGLTQDARVVIGGTQRLRDGIEVREARNNSLAAGG
jgi:membrane fusion protein (multidrug efflux system)